VLAGHRRRAAAIANGDEEIRGVIRDDLAGPEALVVMLAENDPAKRHALTPLAEARVFAQLAERGWSQRQIASRVGCKQPHVSKRLALLRLPEPAIEALATGEITPADGAELARLDGHPDEAARALADIRRRGWEDAQAIVRHQLARLERAEQAAKVRAGLEAEGIPVVDPGILGPFAYAKRLRDGTDLEAHRSAGCLVGVARDGFRELYCKDADRHEGTPAEVTAWTESHGTQRDEAEARRAAENRQRAAAAKARKVAAGRLAVMPVPPAQAADLLAAVMVERHTDAQCLETAVRWLRDAGLGPAGGDHYAYERQVSASGVASAVRRLAVAMAVASDERSAAGQPGHGDTWGARQVAYLDRLIADVAYEPGEWEAARLAEARARVEARAQLCCLACGCRRARPCGQWIHLDNGAPSSCDALPTEAGPWEYRCGCGRTAGGTDEADGDEADRDDLFDAVEALAFVLDRAGTVAEEMSEALAAAVEEPADALTEAFAQQDGVGDMTGLLQAVRGLHEAALPYESGWPERLQAAFKELAACGVIAGESEAAGQVVDHG
jgi:ParB-like chromosome segregation protein Spo0J